MTETVRYALIGRQDLKIGTGTFEVRLGDGRVVILDEIRLTDLLSTLTVGSVLFVKAGGVAGEDNSNLFWDDTNNRLGVGTASPSQPLHIVGIILSEANLTFKSGTGFTGTLDHGITADRTWTLPNATDTLIALATADTLTNKTLLATGTGNIVTGVIDRDVVTADVVNTITQTTVYSFSVPGGTLSTNRALRLTLIGDYLNNTGVNRQFDILVNFGATGIFDFTWAAVTASASRRMISAVITISAANATNAQVSLGRILFGTEGAAGGIGSTTAREWFGGHNSIAEDSTVAKTLEVTFKHNVADANLSARALAVQLEVLV